MIFFREKSAEEGKVFLVNMGVGVENRTFKHRGAGPIVVQFLDGCHLRVSFFEYQFESSVSDR
ncbi:hypothetical protein D3C73_1246870 [compost metagenome]